MYDYTNKQLNIRREFDFILSKTLSMFKYEGLPETIPQRELERQLQINGYAFVTKVKGKLYSFTGGLGGIPDVYGNPTQITIANPYLDYNATLDLKKDGVLIRNDSMQNGIKHLLLKYIYMMNESEISMVVNSFNVRFPTLLSAGDDKTKESAELYLKRVIDGELGVIAENRIFEGISSQTSGGGGSQFTQLIEYQQYLKATLYNELGLEMNNNMKRERLTEDEVNITDIIYPFVDNMMSNRQEGIEEVNKMFGKEIEVGFDSIWAKHAPSDAFDEEAFYSEVDMYLEALLGGQDEPLEEDIFPDVSEEQLQDILDQLKGLSEEEEDVEDAISNGGGEGSSTTPDGELEDTRESGGDSGSSRGTGSDDNEPGDSDTGPDNGSDGESEKDRTGDRSDDGDEPTSEPTSDSSDEPDTTSTEPTDEGSGEPSDEVEGETQHGDADSTTGEAVGPTSDVDVEINIDIKVDEEEDEDES